MVDILKRIFPLGVAGLEVLNLESMDSYMTHKLLKLLQNFMSVHTYVPFSGERVQGFQFILKVLQSPKVIDSCITCACNP